MKQSRNIRQDSIKELNDSIILNTFSNIEIYILCLCIKSPRSVAHKYILFQSLFVAVVSLNIKYNLYITFDIAKNHENKGNVYKIPV